MSLREYFAARAPHEIPVWFEPTIAGHGPKLPTEPKLASERAQRLLVDWKNDPCFDMSAFTGDLTASGAITSEDRVALEQFETIRTQYWKDLAAHEHAYEIARIAEWPWAWADLVLAAPR